ncbi:DUF952 domain-containing protein [Myxosarcina sp. GI1(2024)]
MERQIYHITSLEEWQQAQSTGEYRPSSFATEGFIHCSYAWQLLPVANRLFRGRDNLAILAIAPSLVTGEIVEENLLGEAELFPHLYGSLPIAAVVEIIAFPCNSDGSFDLPTQLAK